MGVPVNVLKFAAEPLEDDVISSNSASIIQVEACDVTVEVVVMEVVVVVQVASLQYISSTSEKAAAPSARGVFILDVRADSFYPLKV